MEQLGISKNKINKVTVKKIAYLFSAHDITSLSRQEQVSLMRLFREILLPSLISSMMWEVSLET